MRFLCFITAITITISSFAQQTQRLQLFDQNWKFYRGGVERGQIPAFDDSKWRTVDLPHDWSIEDLPGTNSPFNPDAISQVSGGFTTGGTGWYRKSFTVPPNWKQKRVIIVFEGVYMNSDVWVNGMEVGNHPYGYTSFWYDITDKLKFGENNSIAVSVKNEGQNSRWYSGSGIYRHVWLKIVDPTHIDQWGVAITTPQINSNSATVHIDVKLTNANTNQPVKIINTIYNSEGQEVGSSEQTTSVTDIVLSHPRLWSTENPVLYTLRTRIEKDGDILDEEKTKFGIRTITYDNVKGLMLNNEPIKLKGGCYHNDNGPLGSKSYDRAEERRVELMKASGFNAIRCSHNPPAPSFLEACDRLGVMVIDEAFDMWQDPKNSYDYHLYFNQWWKKDMESMILRDRNHASIIMWSIGNEIPNRDKPEVVETAKMLVDFTHSIDKSRWITSAVNDVKEDKDPYFQLLDVAGYNYAVNKYESDHLRMPSRIMMGTESYALEAFDYWMSVKDHPYVIGDFIWTGFDYIGEASIGWRGYWQEKNFYPWNLAYCGDIDICGWKRPQSFYRDALWKPNQLSIFVKPLVPSFEPNPNIEVWSKWNWYDAVGSWNWPGNENKSMDVTVYSSCDEIELFQNDHSLGRKSTNRANKFMATWKVPYKQGTLSATGYNNKKRVNSAVLKTAGEPAAIKLVADRTQLKADGEDLSYVTIELTDAQGVRNPLADNLLTFEVEGPATIAGVGNANPVSLESYQSSMRKAWQGKCLVILKSSNQAGKVTLHVKSTGVPEGKLDLQIN